MALSVIAAGWSRTGTFSLKLALAQLGFGPCYHAHEMFAHPEHVDFWERVDTQAQPEWETVFAGYRAATDAPACIYWRQLCERYPDARVILTVRDADAWYDSMASTVVEMMRKPERLPAGPARRGLQVARRLMLDNFFGGAFDDRAQAIACWQAHNAAVQAELPSERLLVYRLEQGWEPLCRFLGVPVPQQPFPVTNDRATFRARSGLR